MQNWVIFSEEEDGRAGVTMLGRQWSLSSAQFTARSCQAIVVPCPLAVRTQLPLV